MTSGSPIVAIVGRPNVGKSTLFNRLAGKPLAIVHDLPGVTRDRNYTDILLRGRDVTLIDTGGFDRTTDDPMGQGIARHVEAAIEEADVVLCVLDASMPPTEPDREAIALLRRSQKPVLYVANKVDGANQELTLSDLYELGVGDLIAISALHGRHTGALEDALASHLPPPRPSATKEEEEEILSVAFIGRPNAGKSSLFNQLSGKERSLVDGRPGTTRDPIDSTIVHKGDKFLVVDTAGIRRKSRVEAGIEAHSVIRSLRVINRAHVIVLLSDMAEGIADQDANLLGLCADRGRAIVVGLNKSDLFDRTEVKKHIAAARHELHFATWAPIVPLSAQTGHGVAQLMKQVSRAGQRMKKRIPTSSINRFFERIILEHPPPTRAGKAPRIYYLTQTNVNPPTFVAFCSSPDHVAESYKRFVVNRIRTEFDYEAVPLRLYFRGKDRE